MYCMALQQQKTTTLQKYILMKDRVELYKDFSLNLLHYFHKYYIDKKSLSTDIDIEHHFNFCYNKVCDEFKEEGINFSTNSELKKYFYDYYYEYLYKTDRFDGVWEMKLSEYCEIWDKIFNIDTMKNRTSISMLVDIYLIFDDSVEKKK